MYVRNGLVASQPQHDMYAVIATICHGLPCRHACLCFYIHLVGGHTQAPRFRILVLDISCLVGLGMRWRFCCGLHVLVVISRSIQADE